MEEKNRLIELDKQIRELTDDLSYLMPGPYGIGMVSSQQSQVRGYLKFEPEPVLNCVIFPEEIKEYEITVGGHFSGIESEISVEELEEQALSSSFDTRITAKMLLKLKDIRLTVTRETCSEAFSILVDRMLKEAEEEENMQQIEQSM